MKRVSIAKLEVTFENETEKPERAVELFHQYTKASKLYRPHLEVTEEGPNDDLVMVVSHFLRQEKSFFEGCAVCLHALKNTPYAFQPKLLLIEFAKNLGAFHLAEEMYKLLDIKYVQLDSMGHYALYVAVRSGQYGWLDEFYHDVKAVRETSVQRFIPQDTAKCFSHCKWSQIEGFQHFASRVVGSWHFHMAHVEHILASLLIGGGAEKTVEDIKVSFKNYRAQGLVTAGIESTAWLERLVDWCNTYTGKEDLRLFYNYDQRVQANYSSSGLKTKKEWRDTEWVVPKAELLWMKSRILLLLVLEKACLAESESIGGLVNELVALWKQTDLTSNSNIPASSFCYNVLEGFVLATSLVSASKLADKEGAGQSYKSVTASFLGLESSISALRHHLIIEGEKSLVAPACYSDISFATFEILPIGIVLAKAWKQFLPTKGVRNKMQKDTKDAFLEMLGEMKKVSHSLEQLCQGIIKVSKADHAKDEEVLSWAEKSMKLTGAIDGEFLKDACGRINRSWRLLLTNVLAKATHFASTINLE